MRACGIIAEYDPLHNGHAWQIEQARKESGAQLIVVVMSCCFTQRGMPALLSPHARAEMALHTGADIVLGLPYSFSVCDAERFALGGVCALSRSGLVDCISFGVEPGNAQYIPPAAQLLENPTDDFTAILHENLSYGMPYPRAQGEALSHCLRLSEDILSVPNTVLGICYARANMRLRANLALIPVDRRGAYHAAVLPIDQQTDLPSATAVRAAIADGSMQLVRHAMPDAAYRILEREISQGRQHEPHALDMLLRWTLQSERDFSSLPNLSEGLENRLPLGGACLTREDMVQQIRSKRYPYARVNRLLTHALTETRADALSPLPQYAYLLGFKRQHSPLLRTAERNGFALLPKLTVHHQLPEQLLDARAWDLWALGAHQPFGALYRCQPVIT